MFFHLSKVIEVFPPLSHVACICHRPPGGLNVISPDVSFSGLSHSAATAPNSPLAVALFFHRAARYPLPPKCDTEDKQKKEEGLGGSLILVAQDE